MPETIIKQAVSGAKAGTRPKKKPESAANGKRAEAQKAEARSAAAKQTGKPSPSKGVKTGRAEGTSVAKPSKAKGKSAAGAKRASSAGPSKGSSGAAREAAAPRRAPASRAAISKPRAVASRKKAAPADLFLERCDRRGEGSGGVPPRTVKGMLGALNACLAIGIAVLIALGARQQTAYAEFLRMRRVVDQQTFYEGTTVEGVDVSKMTLSNALDYWRDRVEPRYAGRTVTLENGATVTAGELGYSSDYESVLYAAWSAGRSGSLEQRYRSAAYRQANPVAYSVTRSDYSDATVAQYVQVVAMQVDQPAVAASIQSFNPETYEFELTESQPGRKLDTEALRASIEAAIAAGGGSVPLSVSDIAPETTTEEVASSYGLVAYAVTNANSSSRARLNNIKLAMSLINGTRVAPGETFSFNDTVGERTTARGFQKATAYSGGDVTEQVGGGICQVSTTLFNAAVKADMEIVERHNHSLTVAYVDKGKDATVDWGHQDFRFKNTSDDDVFICCYLTDDKRVRFGIFGKLLPNGETITVDAVTTEVVKYETKYEQSPLLAPGQTYLLQNGRNGYKAEAYKVRWDAEGNQLSKELLCKSVYQMKNEIVQYGA